MPISSNKETANRLGYSFDDGTLILELMTLGSHETFIVTLNVVLKSCNCI